MKKASRILLTIGGALHIVNGVAFILASFYLIIAAIAFFAFGYNWFAIPYETASDAETASLAFNVVALVYIILAITFITLGIFGFCVASYTFKTRDIEAKGRYITTIVFGAIFDNPCAVIGSIFGLIVLNKKGQDPEVVDPE